jgi:peptidoglycan hydrolase-like protein with peptidoglycan-binding domain
METLAYLHLTLAHEASASADYTASIFTWDQKHFVKLNLSSRAAIQLFCLTIALLLFGMANQALALVQEGDRGTEVTTLQQRLQELGYFQGNITGYFGSLTKQAVSRFQEAKGLTADGVVGTNTQALLQGQAKVSKASVKEYSSPILRIGDRGSDVSAIQESLAVAGFSGGRNGVFDTVTQEAVKRFQQAKGLTVDGIVGSQTRAALPAIGGSNPTPVAKTPTSQPDIKALQKRLQARGFYGGSIDGLWGPLTQAAVESAQRAYDVGANDLPNRGF